jgi:hypothetical protein
VSFSGGAPPEDKQTQLTNGTPFLPYRLKDEISHYNKERKPYIEILKTKHYYHVTLLHNTCPEILTVASKGKGKINY